MLRNTLGDTRARQLLEEAVREARKLIDLLESEGIRVEAAFLFGSRARGDAIAASDIDLVVVSEDFKRIKYIDRLELIYSLEWRHGIKPWIEVIPLAPEELEEKLSAPTIIRSASRYWKRII